MIVNLVLVFDLDIQRTKTGFDDFPDEDLNCIFDKDFNLSLNVQSGIIKNVGN